MQNPSVTSAMCFLALLVARRALIQSLRTMPGAIYIINWILTRPLKMDISFFKWSLSRGHVNFGVGNQVKKRSSSPGVCGRLKETWLVSLPARLVSTCWQLEVSDTLKENNRYVGFATFYQQNSSPVGYLAACTYSHLIYINIYIYDICLDTCLVQAS